MHMSKRNPVARYELTFLQAVLTGVMLLAGGPGSVSAQSLAPPVVMDELRWQKSIDAFAAEDRLLAPPTGGIVFVGSSSIRLWDELEMNFRRPDRVILNRGFGGARMSDCTRYLERVVIPYKPRLVLVYAGDNDLAEGREPVDVLNQFVSFVGGVRRSLPDTRIAYISIKPSPARQRLMVKVRETNDLVANYVASSQNLDFIDVFTPMLDAEGQPRRELFRADSLHLSRDGYALWKSIIAPHLR
jgi:lysophospholipase L1-like esterase